MNINAIKTWTCLNFWVFTVAQFYNNLNHTMAIMFPPAVEYRAETSVSIKRLQVKYVVVTVEWQYSK